MSNRVEPKMYKGVKTSDLKKFMDKQRKLEIPIEMQMNKEELEHLHNCIHYTHTVLKDEAEKRIEEGVPQ